MQIYSSKYLINNQPTNDPTRPTNRPTGLGKQPFLVILGKIRGNFHKNRPEIAFPTPSYKNRGVSYIVLQTSYIPTILKILVILLIIS